MSASAPEALINALYVVATPLGNLRDITLRALDVLRGVDVIACEDTRHTAHLLAAHGIRTPLLALHEHNERAAAQTLIARIQGGASAALVSDAGTPAISDPGALTVAAAHAAGVRVIPIPGASAAVTALAASGLQGGFRFVGFLPEKTQARARVLDALIADADTLVFYEAPHRIEAMLQGLVTAFPASRPIVIARELTKLFETIHRSTIGEVVAWLQADVNRSRGEFVVLVAGAGADEATLDEAPRVLALLLPHTPIKTAVALTLEILGARTSAKRNGLYDLALALQKERAEQSTNS